MDWRKGWRFSQQAWVEKGHQTRKCTNSSLTPWCSSKSNNDFNEAGELRFRSFSFRFFFLQIVFLYWSIFERSLAQKSHNKLHSSNQLTSVRCTKLSFYHIWGSRLSDFYFLDWFFSNCIYSFNSKRFCSSISWIKAKIGRQITLGVFQNWFKLVAEDKWNVLCYVILNLPGYNLHINDHHHYT